MFRRNEAVVHVRRPEWGRGIIEETPRVRGLYVMQFPGQRYELSEETANVVLRSAPVEQPRLVLVPQKSELCVCHAPLRRSQYMRGGRWSCSPTERREAP
jgi:hypothetical protein